MKKVEQKQSMSYKGIEMYFGVLKIGNAGMGLQDAYEAGEKLARIYQPD